MTNVEKPKPSEGLSASSRTAVVLGASGQDGRLLTQQLLTEGWSVIGVSRTLSPTNPHGVVGNNSYEGVQGSITDQSFLNEFFLRTAPDAVFNVAGFTHVGNSWDAKLESREVNFVAVKKIVMALELVRSETGKAPHYYHSSSSEIFGGTAQKPQAENTPLDPATPYGEHKALAHSFLQNRRESSELPITIGILYNHESPLRPVHFVSRKISAGVAAISAGHQDKLVMGNIDSSRDWGFAGDYVDAMVQLVTTRSTGDFVVATGVEHSVKEFIAQAFMSVGIADWERYVEISSEFFREADPNTLVGDPSKIYQTVGWSASTSFEDLVRMMVAHDKSLLGA